MKHHDNNLVRMTSVRPLVRYVDEQRCVIDLLVSIHSSAPRLPVGDAQAQPMFSASIQMSGLNGSLLDDEVQLQFIDGAASVRFELLSPERWWPAGMGEQPLYNLNVTLFCDDAPLDRWRTTIGLTSVRCDEPQQQLIVNGRLCPVSRILAVEPQDENGILPVSPDAMLLVRDHIGPSVLYDAADRAGILLVQCVTSSDLSQSGSNDTTSRLASQIDRLVTHPCLAGWYIDMAEHRSEFLASELRRLDPAHRVFRSLPSLHVA